MKNPFSSFLENKTEQERNAFWALLTFLVAYVVIFGIYLTMLVQTGASQFMTLSAFMLVLVVIAIAALLLNRSGKRTVGILLNIGAMALLFPITPMLLAGGIGIVLGIVMAVTCALISTALLPPKQVVWGIVAGVVSGVASFLIDVFWTADRLTSPFVQSFIIVVAVLGIIVFAAIAARQFRNYSLRTKMILIFGIVVVTALGAIAYFNDRNSRAALTASAEEKLLTASSQVAVRIDDLISSNLNIVRAEATTPDFANYLFLKALGLPSDPQAESVTTILNSFVQRDPQNITSYALLDRYGVDLIDTYTADIGLDKSNRDYFITPMKTGDVYVSPIKLSPTRPGDTDLYFASPVKNAAGETIGILRFSLSMKKIQELIASATGVAGPESFAVLLDENHVRLAHGTSPDLVFKSVVPLDPTLLARLQAAGRMPAGSAMDLSTNLPDTEASLQKIDTNPVFTAGSAALSGQLASTAVTRLKTQPWILYVRQSQSVFLAPIEAQTRTMLLLTVLITFLANGVAVGLAQFLATPIVHLTATAEKIAAGDLNTQARVETNDEIGRLASTFNKMTAQLRGLIGSLEQRVAERTHSLELAGEVGRAVSQVRALDVMLKDAAELIRSQFDLYYTQVYLANPAQSELILQAGTGTVGAELIGRGHRLPLNTGSINGRAATEKRSVVVSDTAASATFRPNPLLPDTRSEMAVPLLVGEKVVGVLDLQSKQAGALSQDMLPAFEALAGQLAIAIQNANLLAETEEARAEVEKQARRLVRTGWEEYQDAVHLPEHTGFVFDQNKIIPLAEAEEFQTADGRALAVPISIAGEPVGTLVVEMEEQKQGTQTAELVNIVARQVAQQVESLRLLDSAERYRYEAEQATRRLTREGWKSYMDSEVGSGLSYLYDLKEVRPYDSGLGQHAEESAVSLPLKVRDQTVGKLSVMGLEENDSQSLELANAVIERLGAHIESLRQYDQTQSALAQSEKLFNASRSLTEAADLQELVAVAVGTLNTPNINRAVLTTFNYDSTANLESLDIIANWWNGTGHEVTAIGTHYPLDVIRAMPMFISPTPVFFNDAYNDERVDKVTLELVKRQNLSAVAVLPLHIGSRQIGALILEAEEPHNFTQDEIRLFSALAPQIATVLENRRQFERAQLQAEREAKLNVISQKIQGATTVDAALQIAARELGRALGAPLTIAQLGLKSQDNGGNGNSPS